MQFIGVNSNKKYFNTSIWHGDDYELLDIDFEVKKDVSLVTDKFKGMWRYKNFFPHIESEKIVSVEEGITPLIPIKLGSKTIKVKLEQLFLSGSYKDRGASVLISFAKKFGIKHVVQDSSGNAGASIAVYCALAGILCDIFVPKDTPEAKVVQAKVSGANVNIVDGDREQTAKTAFEAAKKSYYASHCYNPLFFEGTKTFLFEVFEQLNFKMPDAIVLPAGNGTLLIGCHIAIKQLQSAGMIKKIPKLIAVQSLNCSPLNDILHKTKCNFQPTIAEGIAIKNPVRLNQMADAVLKTDGLVICVGENEIIEMWKKLAAMGFMVEPTSAATISGAQKYIENYFNVGEVISLFSGHGLKATDKWLKSFK